jgi:hypothetical protein
MLRSTLEAEDRFPIGSPDTAEALFYQAATAEQDQPRGEWRTKQLEA